MDRFLKLQQLLLSISNLRQCLTLLSWLALAGAATAQQFPYMAYVTTEQVYVRSGPGQRYYPTGQISQGFAVEVYRHDGDGWCAIRPPEGSFSWVPSHQVRPTDAGIVEVVDEHVVARVGSTLSPNRSAVQVLLPKGERIEIFAATEADDPRWVRVAAPAGEFRWIAASDLSRQPPLEIAPVPQSTGSGWSQQSERSLTNTKPEPTVFDHLNQTTNNVTNNTQAGLQFGPPSKNPISALAPVVSMDSKEMEVVAGSPADLQLAQFQSETANTALPALLRDSEAASLAAQTSQPRVRFRGLTPAPSATVGSVEELELRLSQAVVLPPQQWELGPLEAAANSLLAATKTPPVRAQLREVLERITRFQQVQQRYNNPAMPTLAAQDPFETPTEADGANGLTGQSSTIRDRARQDLASKPRTSSDQLTSSAKEPLYDAAGLLKPVVSKREQAPQYALVDERGKVVSFVTPTPDLNLTPYLGRRIGVNGTRGYMPEYRRAHVTAGRVTPIDGTVRR